MTENIKVWVGTVDDVHEVMDIAMMGALENGFLSPNPLCILQEIYPALARDWGIMGLIGERGKPLEGAVLLRVVNIWYSGKPCLEERAIFVHPDFRNAKGGRAARLCEFSKLVADRLKLPLMIGVLSNSRTAAKVKMYERQFGPQAGAYFLYGAQTGAG